MQCVGCLCDAVPMPDPCQVEPCKYFNLVLVLPLSSQPTQSAARTGLNKQRTNDDDTKNESNDDPVTRRVERRRSIRALSAEFSERRHAFYADIKKHRELQLQEARAKALAMA
jgi:hypothetical protein